MNRLSFYVQLLICSGLNLVMLGIVAMVANTDLQMSWVNSHFIILFGCFIALVFINLLAGYMIGYERGKKSGLYLELHR